MILQPEYMVAMQWLWTWGSSGSSYAQR